MMLRWTCWAAVFLLDVMGLGDLYQVYRFLVEFDTPDDELP
jgi:hypothetical protein